MDMPARESVRTICKIGKDGKGYCERSDGSARIPIRKEGDILTPTGDGEGSKDALLNLFSDFSRRDFKVKNQE